MKRLILLITLALIAAAPTALPAFAQRQPSRGRQLSPSEASSIHELVQHNRDIRGKK